MAYYSPVQRNTLIDLIRQAQRHSGRVRVVWSRITVTSTCFMGFGPACMYGHVYACVGWLADAFDRLETLQTVAKI